MALEEDQGFKNLAALELAKDIGKGGTKLLRIDLVEDGAHLGVGRDVLKAEERAEVGFVVAALIIEGQKRRHLESKDSKARHEGIAKRNLCGGAARIGDRPESGAYELIKSIARQLLAFLRTGVHGKSLCAR